MKAPHSMSLNGRGRAPVVVVRDLFRSLVALAALVCLAPSAMANECRSLEAVEWVLGEWTRSSEKSTTLEWWRRVSDVTFEGANTTTSVSTGEVLNFETLRLVAMSDGVFYIAKVAENVMPVPFRLTRCSEGAAVFENPAHDFPQRLTYRHHVDRVSDEPDRMEVTVDGGDGKAFTLVFIGDGG